MSLIPNNCDLFLCFTQNKNNDSDSLICLAAQLQTNHVLEKERIFSVFLFSVFFNCASINFMIVYCIVALFDLKTHVWIFVTSPGDIS